MAKKESNTTQRSDLDHLALMRIEDICQLTTLKKSSIFKAIKNGSIPKPIKLMGKINAWYRSEVINWVESMRSND